MAEVGILPPDLAALIGDAEITPVGIGASPAQVVRVRRGDEDWFVKLHVDPHDLDVTPAQEAERLVWLADHVPVPELIASGGDGRHEWIITRALPGSDATQPEHHGDASRLLVTLATALRRFHDSVPVASCPFDARTDTVVAVGVARAMAGLVDPAGFDAVHQGSSVDELVAAIGTRRPVDPEHVVVTHGDFSVPNVILEGGTLSGYVDVGRCGVGDRYLDLADAARSVARNIGPQAVGPFFDAYGIEWPDVARLDFFVMLAELG